MLTGALLKKKKNLTGASTQRKKRYQTNIPMTQDQVTVEGRLCFVGALHVCGKKSLSSFQQTEGQILYLPSDRM